MMFYYLPMYLYTKWELGMFKPVLYDVSNIPPYLLSEKKDEDLGQDRFVSADV